MGDARMSSGSEFQTVGGIKGKTEAKLLSGLDSFLCVYVTGNLSNQTLCVMTFQSFREMPKQFRHFSKCLDISRNS